MHGFSMLYHRITDTVNYRRGYKMQTKICSKCGPTPKPITDFGKDAEKKDGLRTVCKKCTCARVAAYRAANPEKAKAACAAYRAANPDRGKMMAAAWRDAYPEMARASAAAYRSANRDRAKEKTAAWCKANPEKVKANNAAWYAANADKVNARRSANPEPNRIYCQNRRARRVNNGGKLSIGLSDKLFKLQRGMCACCNKPLGNNYHLDHIMPLALGGTNEDKNIQLLRAKCNLQKNKKHPVEFMRSRGFLL